MNPAYENWIRDYRTANDGFVRGKCKEACEAMQKVFPELILTPGVVTYLTVHDGCTRNEQHMWLTTPDGERIDPTVAQFTGPIIGYRAIDPDDEEMVDKFVPIGTCPDCGDSYTKAEEVEGTFCSTSCRDAYMRYLNGGVF